MRPLLTLALLALLGSGCSRDAEPLQLRSAADTRQSDAAEAFVGSWTYTSYVSPREIAEVSDDPIPPGVEIDLTAEGATTYHANDRYDASAEVTIRVRQAGQEVPLRFLRRDAGTWEVSDGVLFETVTSGRLTPLDATTRQFLRETPEVAAFISPIEGETASTTIESVSATAIDLQEQESQLRFTLRRDE